MTGLPPPQIVAEYVIRRNDDELALPGQGNRT
jgi:hypothetical protein